MDDPIFIELSQLYVDSTKLLTEQVNGLVQTVKKSAADVQCYDDSIVIVQNLGRSLDKGLKMHLPQEFQDEAEALLETWIQARQKQESAMDDEGASIELAIREWATMLDRSAPSSTFWKSASQGISRWITGRRTSCTYDRLKGKLTDKVM